MLPTVPPVKSQSRTVRAKPLCWGCMMAQSGEGTVDSRGTDAAVTLVVERHKPRSHALQDSGALLKKSESRTAQEQLMNNPDMMMGMMKGQITGFLPQVTHRPAVYYLPFPKCSPGHTSHLGFLWPRLQFQQQVQTFDVSEVIWSGFSLMKAAMSDCTLCLWVIG